MGVSKFPYDPRNAERLKQAAEKAAVELEKTKESKLGAKVIRALEEMHANAKSAWEELVSPSGRKPGG